MSTRSDYNIKISEAFINTPDLSSISDQKFVIDSSNWFGQVFVSKSNDLQKIFFLCDNTEGLELNIHKATVTIENGVQIFTPGQIVVSIIHEVDEVSPFVEVDSDEDDPEAKWYYPNWLAIPQIDELEGYYIAVFKTTTTKTPTIYWTLNYRQSVFPEITGWDGTSWSNDNIDTVESGNKKIGAICFGNVGNNLRDSTLDSGSLTIGGRDSARRGYPIYVIVENISSQSNIINVDLSIMSPLGASYGSRSETNQSMMKWYRFNTTTLPTSSNYELLASDVKTGLSAENNFVIYVQPDKLSPLAEPFLPESELGLSSNPLGFLPVYGYSYGYDSFNTSGLVDSVAKFDGLDYWANFATEMKVFNEGQTRKAIHSQNADFIDFSLEDPDGDIDLLKNVALTGDLLGATTTEYEWIRGFDKGIFYKDKYVLFSKLVASSPDVWPDGKLLSLIFDKNLVFSSKKKVSLLDSSTSTLGADSTIIGIHDITKRIISGVETLIFIFQNVRPNSLTHSWFDIGYYQGDWSEPEIEIQLIRHDSAGAGAITGSLGSFSSTDEGEIDEIGLVKFIEPKNLSSFYITARGASGLAMFEINDGDTLSSSYIAEIVNTNNSTTLTGISNTDDLGIDYVFCDGLTTYLGVRRSFAGNNFAAIYRTDDFVTFEQIFADNLSTPSSVISGFSCTRPNNKVAFMYKVLNMLHVWITPELYYSDGTPMHIAINTITREVKVLRKFPITSDEYDGSPSISNLSIFNKSKSLRYISGGSICGNKIYIHGADKIEYFASTNLKLPEYYSTRWLVYDDRIINDAFYFDELDNGSRYNGKTLSSLNYDDGADFYKTYPGLFPDSTTSATNPRVIIYCGAVNGAVSEEDGIESYSNVADHMFVSGGITYLTTRNYNNNFDIFKTYGVKENPRRWGRSLTGGSGNINSYTSADIDNPNYEKVVANSKSMFNLLSRRSVPIFLNDVVLFSEIKSNNNSDGYYSTDTGYLKRTIMVLKKSLRRPQNISAVYQLRYVGTSDSERNSLLDTSTSNTVLTIKGAQSLEDLYLNPDFVETIPLAFDLSKDDNSLYIIDKTFKTDLNSNFFRIESIELLGTNYASLASIRLKDLRLFDVDPSGSETGDRNVAVCGLLKSNKYTPENILRNGVELGKNGEVIIDFIKPTYINKITFDATYLSKDTVTSEMTEFEFSAIYSTERRNTGNNIIGPNDWSKINNVRFGSFSNKKNIKLENIGCFVSKLKIKLLSNYSFKINNFKVYGFLPDINNIVTTGSVKTPESIFFDDVSGLLEFSTVEDKNSTFTVFESNNCSMTIDLEDDYPISRIAMNVSGEGETSSRTLVVETWDGTTLDDSNDPLYENIFTGPAPNYEFSIVRWIPRLKDKSRNVEIEFLDSVAPLTPDEILTNANVGDLLLDYNNVSNNSSLLARSGLTGWSFKPSLFNDRSLSVISSQSRFETGNDNDYIDDDADGLIVVNCQMDEDGPFAPYVGENSLGLLENKISIDFSVKNIKKIRITLRNQNNGDGEIRINGLRLFTPVKNSAGLAISPIETTEWDLKFGFSVSSE